MHPNKEIYLKAISKIERFSPAARVLGQAMALLRDPDADISSIADLIKTDTGLTTDLIRGANSAYYSAGERVSNLDRAVQKIGFSECIRLVNLSVAHRLASRNLTSYGIAAEDFWAESLFNGIFMESLAKATRALDSDTAHTVGLLRYVGRLAIDQALNDLGAGLFWNSSMTMRDWELQQIGFTQTEAAGTLLRAWRFSEEICEAIEWQDDPTRSSEEGNLLAALHFTASVLPEGLGLSYAVIPQENPDRPVAETRFITDYGITAEFTKELLDTSREQFAEVSGKLYGNK